MGIFEATLATFLQWLLKATLQGSLLVCFILLIKVILRERLPARWHYCLWLVLLLRLALPWAPPSRISIYSLIPGSFSSYRVTSGLAVPPPHEARARPGAIVRGNSAARTSAADRTGTSQTGQGGTGEAAAIHPPSETPASFNEQSSQASGQDHRLASFVARVLAWVWLAGGAALAGYILIRAFALWRAVTSERPVTDQSVLELLEDCKMQMRVRILVGVVVTDKVQTPALFGVIRPRILLPHGLIGTFGLDELHCIFLHELAHLKRRDICLAWLVCLLQVLHWFNPLIWFAFRRMRADQEMAADALALATAGADESRRYGQTIVSLLERFSRPQYLPSLAGILENPSHIERRIQMIAQFRQTTHRPLLATALLAVLMLIALTDAQNKPESDKPVSVTPQATGPGATEKAPPAGESDTVVDPKTGIKVVLAKTISGTNNFIEHVNRLTLSPDGRFLLWWDRVAPLDGTEAFRSGAGREVAVSPNGRYVAHGEDDAVWVQPVSPETLRPDGPAKKLLDLKGERLFETWGRPEALHWTGDSETVFFRTWATKGEDSQYAFSAATGARVDFPDAVARGLRSPDGTCVAFTDGTPGFSVQRVGEGAARKLCSEGPAPLSWSADGRWLIGIAGGGEVVRFTQYPDGQEYLISLPKELEGSSLCVGTSLDKKMLFFYQPGYELKNRIKVASASDAPLKDVDVKRPADFQWTPDGKSLLTKAYTAQGETKLLTSPLSGGEPVQFTIGKVMGLSVSPDVKWFLSRQGGARMFDLSVQALSTANREATGPATVIFHNAHCSADMGISVWSPDSTRVALTSKEDSGDGEGLWIAFTDGKAPLRLTRTTAKEHDLRWSPDASLLAFVSQSAEARELMVVPTTGGETTSIRKWNADQGGEWAWSSDSRSLTIEEEGTLVRQPLSGGRAESIANLKESGVGWTPWLSWSPDGSRLALVCNKPGNKDLRVWGQLLFVRVEEGRLLRTAAVDLKGGSWNYAWSPDSEHVAYTCEDAVVVRPEGRLYALAVADILERISVGAIPLNRKQTATPAVEKPSTEPGTVRQVEPIVGPVFSDNFDNGASKHWRSRDLPDEGPLAGHTVENGQLVLANAQAILDGIDWTDYIVTVRVCIKEPVTSRDGHFGLVGRAMPSRFGSSRMDRYSLIIFCNNNASPYLWLGINYADASNVLRNGRLDWSACTIVPDKWYTLGFEVRGQHLRGFLDGKLMVEATDERLSKGGIWLIAYRSRALFDDFSVRQLP